MRILPFTTGRLSRGRFALVDAEDFGSLSVHSWLYRHEGRVGHGTTSVRTSSGHRLARSVLELHGLDLTGMMVRHLNGWSMDCRRSNLAAVTRAGNARTGVQKNIHCVAGVWRVVLGRTPHGSFPTKEAALLAWDDIAHQHGYVSDTEQRKLLGETREALNRLVLDGYLTHISSARCLDDEYQVRES